MQLFPLLCFLLINITLINGACADVESCALCQAAQAPDGGNCGWCVASQQCLPEKMVNGKSQPKDSKCLGSQQWFAGGHCPHCKQHDGDCRSCTMAGAGCGWCPGDASNPKAGRCLPASDMTCSTAQPLLDACPCNEYSSCAICTTFSDDKCGWCEKNQACEPLTTTTCAVATDCPCANNRNCDSCVADFNGLHDNPCEWCGARNGSCTEIVDQKCEAKTLQCPALCATFSDSCEKCQANECAWCSKSNSCVDPGNTDCLVSSICPQKHCGAFGSCDACGQEAAAGCGWCPSIKNNGTMGACVHVETSTCKQYQHNCAAQCNSYKKCDECSTVNGCAWCAKNETRVCTDVTMVGSDQCPDLQSCGESYGVSGTQNFFLGALVLLLIAVGSIAVFFIVKRFRGNRTVYQSI